MQNLTENPDLIENGGSDLIEINEQFQSLLQFVKSTLVPIINMEKLQKKYARYVYLWYEADQLDADVKAATDDGRFPIVEAMLDALHVHLHRPEIITNSMAQMRHLTRWGRLFVWEDVKSEDEIDFGAIIHLMVFTKHHGNAGDINISKDIRAVSIYDVCKLAIAPCTNDVPSDLIDIARALHGLSSPPMSVFKMFEGEYKKEFFQLTRKASIKVYFKDEGTIWRTLAQWFTIQPILKSMHDPRIYGTCMIIDE